MPAKQVTSQSPWHLLLLIDDSGSMSGSASEDMNEAIMELVETLVTISYGQKPYFKISIVSFGSNFKTIAEAISETDIEESEVAQFEGNSGSTNATAALDEAIRILKKYPGKESDFEPFVFFMSDGGPDNSSTAKQSADELKSLVLPAGTPRIITLGFGDYVNDTFMEGIATNSELYKKVATSKDVIKLLPTIGTIGTTAPGGAKDVEEAIMRL